MLATRAKKNTEVFFHAVMLLAVTDTVNRLMMHNPQNLLGNHLALSTRTDHAESFIRSNTCNLDVLSNLGVQKLEVPPARERHSSAYPHIQLLSQSRSTVDKQEHP